MRTWICITFKLIFIHLISHGQTQNYNSQLISYKEKAELLFYSKPDECSDIYKKIIELSSFNKDWYEVFDAYFGINDLALRTNDFELIKTNLDLLDSLTKRKNKFVENSKDSLYLKNYLNYQKGFYYYKIANHNSALNNFQKIILRTEKKPDSLLHDGNKYEVIAALSSIAKIYADEGKYALSRSYYEKTIRFITNRYSEDKDLLFSIYNLFADLLQEEKNYSKSNYFFLKTLPYHEKINSENSIITTTTNIIENYIKLGQLDSAKYYLQRLKLKTSIGSHFHTLYCKTASKFHEANNNKEKALRLLQYNKDLSVNQWKDKSQQVVSESYNLLGKLHQRSNQPNQAVKNFETALFYISKDTVNSTINKTIQLKIIKNKIQALNNLKKYKLSVETSADAISILDRIRPSFKNNNDKLFLIEDAFPLFENSIEAAYNLFLETSETKYIDTAFFYFEKSKSTLLLESLLSTQANSFANIPKDLIEKENLLKSEINYAEKAINKNPSSVLQDQLFELKKEHRELINTIESKYKQYFDLKYNNTVITLDKLQDQLDNNTLAVSYFYGINSIYAISISRNLKHIEKIKLTDSLEKSIRNYHALLSDPRIDINILKKKSKELYQKIISKNLSVEKKGRLIIITDGLLNYIPFESFLSKNSNYLVEDYSISYINSATLLRQLKSYNTSNNKVLGFAPEFTNTNSTLLALPNNSKETERILYYFKGKAFTDKNATLDNFNSKNKDYGIIHLATHAILNDRNPEYSYLAFTPNAKEENLLYTADLYNLQLNANMVTLSACESGIGDLRRGEGMMSLANGFYYSGVKSITSTLWKINDASSSQLMSNFYKHLADGKSKDRALQNAKLDFIKKNKDNALSHPYYWSGFIISGNTTALVSDNNWIYICLSILLLIFLGIFFKHKKRFI